MDNSAPAQVIEQHPTSDDAPNPINAQSNHVRLLREADINAAPMSEDHKQIVITHLRRLHRVLNASDTKALGYYTNKGWAKSGLACMTVVFNDYMAKSRRGEFEDDAVESMVQDMVDASLSIDDLDSYPNSHPSIGSMNPCSFRLRQEFEQLMLAIQAENADAVPELWNVEPNSAIVDHSCSVDNIGEDVDLNIVIGEALSDDDAIYHRNAWKWSDAGDDDDADGDLAREAEAWAEDEGAPFRKILFERTLGHLDRTWPPPSREVRDAG